MWRHIAANALSIIIVALVAVAAFVAWAQSRYTATGPLTQAICLQVKPGYSMRNVASDLVAENAISNGSIFRVGADYSDTSQDLKAGSFLIPEGASMAEIVDLVTRGGRSTCGTEIVYRIGVTAQMLQVRELDPSTNRFELKAEHNPVADAPGDAYLSVRQAADTRYRISLAEGVTSWQIVEALKAADFLQGAVEEVPPEGMLAPDSYEITADTPRADLVAQMMTLQAARLEEAWKNRADDLPISSPEEALILASIIEKETGLPEERGTVASVFVNRLRRGMKLQTDPTVIYGVTEGKAVLERGLRQSELRRETPWNTYVIDGLPPTPIANPGLASIEAALNPDSTPYLFFVADGTGGHAFAETLAEHNANVAKWRAFEAEQSNQ